MSINAKYYEAAQAALEKRRMNNKLMQDMRRREVFQKIPEYAALETKLADTMAQVIPIIAARSSDTHEKMQRLMQDNLATQKQMGDLLEKNGFRRDYLDPIYTCPACCDRGIKDGKWCECFNKLVYNAATKDINDQSPMKLSSFSSFRLDLYPETIEQEYGMSAREIMRRNYNECMNFAEKFTGKGRGIVMLGATGLGKTHLSLAIASRVIERGFSAVYVSVPEILRTLDREQFRKTDENTMSLVTGCDLLILDDLGAEASSERNISMVYELINSRINRQLPIIINTNLSLAELKARYSDRLFSRIVSMDVLMFCGTDNRLKLK